MALPAKYELIDSAHKLRKAVSDLASQPFVGFDCETTSLDPYRGRLRLIQLAGTDGVYVFDIDRLAYGPPEERELIEPLKELLAAPRPIKIAHNAKFDAKWIKKELGIELGGVFDTLLASQLVSAGESEDRHGLDAVAGRYLNENIDKSERLSDWTGELSEAQLDYAARDAAVLPLLREKLVSKLVANGLVKCAVLEFDCVMPVAQLELTGIYLDRERWREQMKSVEQRRVYLASQLQEILSVGASQGLLFEKARTEINLDSHGDVTDALARLGIPMPDSTRSWKLQPLADEYPAIALLLEYRTVQKSLTTYGENILGEINPVTGRIHANFHQIGAPTGRFACTQPNIQQVPHGPEYRSCFRAPEGRKLVISDFSQIELRILAEFAGDRAFLDAFRSGADFHRVTAARTFGVEPDAVTSEQRSFAKRLNFGVVYGLGAQRFAMMTGLSQSDGEEILRRYFSSYPALDAWLREAAHRAVRERSARTMSGRLVRFNFDPADNEAVSVVQRSGKNMPVQGTNADILKRGLRLLHEGLSSGSARIVNIIHDEIVVEAEAGEAQEVAQLVEHAMCAAGEEFLKDVPVKVETEIADEWIK